MQLPEGDGKWDAREDTERYSLLSHLLHFGFVLENKSGGVQAVAEVRRRWAVVKDMPKVTSTARAEDLGSHHA